MKIALLSYEYPPDTGFGGIGTYTYYHARALVKLGHQVHVFAGAARPGAVETEEDGVRVTRFKQVDWLQTALLPARALKYFWLQNRVENARAMYTALKAADFERFDVVEAPECGGDAALISRTLSVPLVVRLHSPARLIMETYDTPAGDRWLTARVEQMAIDRAAVRTACSRFLAREAEGRLHVPPPIHVIPNGIDVDRFDRGDAAGVRARYGLPDDGIVVLFANRLERRKGIHLIADSAARILRRYPQVHFAIAGRDLFHYAGREIAPRMQAEGLDARMHLLGGLGLQDVRALLKTADIFVLPSLWENCPYSCIEAMTAGRAIVSADCGGMPELIADRVNGLLFPTGDAGAFADRIEELVDDRVLRERVGAAARRTVEGRLTDITVAEQSLAVYRTATRVRHAQPGDPREAAT